MLPYSKQKISSTDINNVIKVLKSDFLTQGTSVPRFEKKILNCVKSKFGFAVQNASCALMLSCQALGLEKNDIAWTTPNSFVATANCIKHFDGIIDFVDIDPLSYNISIQELEKKLVKAKKQNKIPKILITVHLGGQPTLQEKIWKLSRIYKFKIIEDASHSLGASRKNEPVGSCKWSDLTVFSFHPVKIITTAEGGFITTNRKYLALKIEMLRNNGITKDNKKFYSKKNISEVYYEQQMLGFNFRMSDVHAAIGISQIDKLKSNILERNKLAINYYKLFKDSGIGFQKIDNLSISSFHLFIIKVKNNIKLISHLRKHKILANVHYYPIHLHPYYKKLGFKKGDFPNAEIYSSQAISIPLFLGLKKSQQLYVVEIIKNFSRVL
jgi:UDP-4-amino-4,6-dideoxy-N-acetyl-beta-L-altrosamine transaminase